MGSRKLYIYFFAFSIISVILLLLLPSALKEEKLIGDVLLFCIVVPLFIGSLFLQANSSQEGRKCQRLYEKTHNEKLSLTNNDRNLVQLLLNKTSGMYFLYMYEPFDLHFGDLFASEDNEGIIVYLKEKGYTIDSESIFSNVLKTMFVLRQRNIDNWNKYEEHAMANTGSKFFKYLFYAIPFGGLIYVLIVFFK